jgi:hypothetical protein
MALDESTNGMDKLESNGVTAYIDSQLNKQLASMGDINVDYIFNESGPSGYRIVIGESKCDSGQCGCQ